MADPLKSLRNRPGRKALAEYLLDNCHSGASSVFRDMLSLYMYICGVAPDAPPEGNHKHASGALNLYAKALHKEPPFEDILGSVYMALAASGHRGNMGQFFTPPEVCQLMARANLRGIQPKVNEPRQRIYDPACGSGAMLLAMANRICEDHGPEALNGFEFFGTDLDRCCALMAATQMLANANAHHFNIGKLRINHANALGQNPFEYTIIHASSKVAWGVSDHRQEVPQENLEVEPDCEVKPADWLSEG